MIGGGVDNMEKYKYLLGQAHAIQITLQEISNLLNNKEQKNEQQYDLSNVVVFGEGNTED
jgi:DNA-binding protein YbaB